MLTNEMFLSFSETKRKTIVRSLFHNRCCRCRQEGHDVHEIVPRSHIGEDVYALSNRILLCHNCHINWVHAKGVSSLMIKYLRYLREKRLKEIYGTTPQV